MVEPVVKASDPVVARLSEKEAIEVLKARYFRFIDTKDWAAIRDLFTDDCKHFLPEHSAMPFMTNDHYFPMLNPGIAVHHGHMPEIVVVSDTEARKVSGAMNDYVQVKPPSGRISIMGWGHYYESYRKCNDGKWRISSKRNTRSCRPGALSSH